MTPRQQEAHDLRETGLTLQKIGEKMGITKQAVHWLLHTELRHTPQYKELKRKCGKNYRKTIKAALAMYRKAQKP